MEDQRSIDGRKLRMSGGLRKFGFGVALSGMAACVSALEPIPTESGLSGFVSVGVGFASAETNMTSGIKSIDLGSEKTDSIYSSPEDEDVVLPVASFELSYTFADTRTQLFVGNLLEDFLRFDLQTNFGVRQEVGGVGTFAVAGTASPLATDTWEDPYVEGANRRKTDRTGKGVRVIWDKIFTLPLELRLSQREIDIDEERSGEWLGLDPADRRLLDRNGDVRRAELLYDMKFGENSRLVPSIAYIDRDLDGDAMAEDGYNAQLSYYLVDGRWRWVGNVAFGQLESDRRNPIYGKSGETDSVAASLTVFYARPFELKGWAANAGIAYFEEDSNIDFYDASVTMFTVGMLYRFD